MPLALTTVTGDRIRRFIPELAALRIGVFREWPYLYEGDPAYEAEYLRVYAGSPTALVVLALDGDRVVGAATAVVLSAEPESMRAPLREAGFDPATTLYLGEFVLYPEFRGTGTGAKFFHECESHARRLGMRHIALCRVVRAADDPRRPAGARELDAFWTRLGCTLRADIRAELSWKEAGAPEPVSNTMEFWVKALR